MPFFTQDFIDFFATLEKNNNKEWFHENKKIYEAHVKEPFKNFTQGLIDALQDIYPNLMMTPKESVMRINRDIRFSKDKTPYKLHMAAFVTPFGRKNMTTPAFMLQANHNDVRVYSGSHGLDKDQLQNVRSHILYNLDEFNTLVNDKKFKGVVGEIRGEKHKRLAPDFAAIQEQQPLIANKGFYYFFKKEPQLLLNDALIPTLVENFKIALPLNRFFEEALA